MATVRGGMFETEVLEAGSGSPVLFLHGTGGLEWGDFLDGLSASNRVIAPRHPGYGDSTGDETLADQLDLLYYYLDFLDAEGLRGIPVIGHSLGAMFAAELAAMQPDRFSRLALIAPLGLWNEAHPVPDFFVMSPKDVAAATYADIETPAAVAAGRAPETDTERVAWMLERVKSQRVAAKYLWPIPNRGLAKRAHRISSPTLLIWGEADGICPPAYAGDFKRLIRHAEVEMIAGAGHLPQVEQAERTLALVQRFIGA
ncbi:MAG TPA: alpha/beta fold hydrolase [Tepidiformaceae bacterium]|nr:alpha/beta fold hydrolase [Tepidiformaceae bacterium]